MLMLMAKNNFKANVHKDFSFRFVHCIGFRFSILAFRFTILAILQGTFGILQGTLGILQDAPLHL
jgi:hypothetical protein